LGDTVRKIIGGIHASQDRKDHCVRIFARFCGSLFVIGSLENSYLSYPRAPEPSSERTVPFHIKGIVVYITRSQRETLSILYYVHGISISLVACILILSREGPLPPSGRGKETSKDIAPCVDSSNSGAVTLVIVLAVGIGLAVVIHKGRLLDAESEAFVDSAVPAIAANWSEEQLLERATSELRESVKPHELRALFDTFSRLGRWSHTRGRRDKRPCPTSPDLGARYPQRISQKADSRMVMPRSGSCF